MGGGRGYASRALLTGRRTFSDGRTRKSRSSTPDGPTPGRLIAAMFSQISVSILARVMYLKLLIKKINKLKKKRFKMES